MINQNDLTNNVLIKDFLLTYNSFKDIEHRVYRWSLMLLLILTILYKVPICSTMYLWVCIIYVHNMYVYISFSHSFSLSLSLSLSLSHSLCLALFIYLSFSLPLSTNRIYVKSILVGHWTAIDLNIILSISIFGNNLEGVPCHPEGRPAIKNKNIL